MSTGYDPSRAVEKPLKMTHPKKSKLDTWDRLFAKTEWRTLTAQIMGDDGTPVFRQENVEVPAGWSDTAANMVASKYFRGSKNDPNRERSVKQLVRRVVETITNYGASHDYFEHNTQMEEFRARLVEMILDQRMAFNSPVWFNVGAAGVTKPQVSACFLLSVEDDMGAILDWYKEEGLVFRGGSGAGVNLSKIRSSLECVTGGGTASGPLPFMKAADGSAGAIKSGGKTRRAAKLVSLDMDHPDILDFIRCKAEEERKAHALIDAGYDGGFNVIGGAYESVAFQNANHSVRVPDTFMQAVEDDKLWSLRERTSDKTHEVSASQLWDAIVKAAWECGDPGMQFIDHINEWHTVPNSGPITTSNPCGEFLHVDDSSCNLASLNLLKYLRFRKDDGIVRYHLESFDTERFEKDIRTAIFAMDILVDLAGYPTEKMRDVTQRHRPLGLGYLNLGAALMACGVAYDSTKARVWAASVTSLLCGAAYEASAAIAEVKGPFAAYEANAVPMTNVIGMHREHAYDLDDSPITTRALVYWDSVMSGGKRFRNSQVVVLAPTGTISLMMDAETTGVEPELALVKTKKLVGGGTVKMASKMVEAGLWALGYADEQIKQHLDHVRETGELHPSMSATDRKVFATSFGSNVIPVEGHLLMMSAVGPFVSGWISKTVNLPHDATLDDVASVYRKAWKYGLKSVALYRDGCKRTQPLNAMVKKAEPYLVDAPGIEAKIAKLAAAPARRRLPQTRQSITAKFSIGEHEGYLTAGKHADGSLGELFIKMNAEGSTLSGVMDTLATTISVALQYGVPLETLVRKFMHVRYEPAGITDHEDIRFAKSITDFVGRWLGLQFLSIEKQRELGLVVDSDEAPLRPDEPGPASRAAAAAVVAMQGDAPACSVCGSIMQRRGSCYACGDCGTTTGCG